MLTLSFNCILRSASNGIGGLRLRSLDIIRLVPIKVGDCDSLVSTLATSWVWPGHNFSSSLHYHHVLERINEVYVFRCFPCPFDLNSPCNRYVNTVDVTIFDGDLRLFDVGISLSSVSFRNLALFRRRGVLT